MELGIGGSSAHDAHVWTKTSKVDLFEAFVYIEAVVTAGFFFISTAQVRNIF